MKKNILSLAIVALMFAACSSNNQQASQGTESTEATETTSDANEITITINAGDDMKFDLSEIKVKEGQTVKLILNHTGNMTKEAMGHNFVLLNAGVVLSDFALAAMKAPDTDYIPAGTTDVIVHTKMIGGGQSDTIEFTAPAKGNYEFLCSFPGHSALMKGTFIVE